MKTQKWRELLKVLTLTKITIIFILLVVILGACVQIYERNSFHNYVIEAAKKGVDSIVNDSTKCFTESNIINKDSVCFKTGCKASTTINNNSNSIPNSNLPENSVLDILSKSDGLLSSNGLTFCVTLITSLLAALIVYKIETNEKYIRETIEKEISLRHKSSSRFQSLLLRIESAYNISILIGNMSTLLQTQPINLRADISINIGTLSSRLSNICSEINSRLKNPKTSVEYLTVDEKSILTMYLEDTLDVIKRCMEIVNGGTINIPDLYRILEGNYQSVEAIKDSIDSIEVKNEL